MTPKLSWLIVTHWTDDNGRPWAHIDQANTIEHAARIYRDTQTNNTGIPGLTIDLIHYQGTNITKRSRWRSDDPDAATQLDKHEIVARIKALRLGRA